MTGSAQIGRIVAAGGAVLMIIGVFLPWGRGLSGNESGWDVLEKSDVIIVVIAALIVIGVAVTLAAGARIPLSAIAAVAAFAGGLAAVFPIEAGTENLKVGIWLTIVGALAALVGAVVAEATQGVRAAPARAPAPGAPPGAPPARGPAPGAPPGAPGGPAPGRPVGPPPPPAPPEQRAPAAAPQPPPGQPAAAPPRQPAPAQPAAAPPAGWYPDPRGEARLRYWDGRGWTGQTSG
jgi:hypothetical protein